MSLQNIVQDYPSVTLISEGWLKLIFQLLLKESGSEQLPSWNLQRQTKILANLTGDAVKTGRSWKVKNIQLQVTLVKKDDWSSDQKAQDLWF